MTMTQSIGLEQIAAHGVVGAGGAGFPTHVKLKAQAEFVLLNAAECEPLLHKDKELMKHHGRAVLQGVEIARQLVGAREAVIGIKGKYTEVIDAIEPQLHPEMSIKRLSDSYPAGDEFILVYDCTKRIIPPGKIPLAVGCVVINVETALNIAENKPVTTKYLTVAGAVNKPTTVQVPVGTTLGEAVELAGGSNVGDPVGLVGGTMMGKFTDDFSQPITKTTGGLIVLDRSHPLIDRYTKTWKQIKVIGASACDQCVFCTYFCPRYLLGHPIEPHAAMRSLGFNEVGEPHVIGTLFCCECNLCTMMACPEDLDPKNVCSTNKHRLMGEGRKWQVEADPNRAELHLDNRRVPIPRLINKLGLRRFNNTGPLMTERYDATKVTLPMRQHIGAPATPKVKVGDRVEPGQLIAAPPPDALGAPIHASIAGTITAADDQVVVIER